jgi:penicillin-binding protein 1C
MPVPEKLKKCVINFEDRRFLYHPGIDPIAVFRAFYGNISGSKKAVQAL